MDQCLMTIVDITETKQNTKYRDLTREILQILNESADIKSSIRRTLDVLKERTGFDAVGIRMRKGNDFPYLDQSGFSSDFLLTENSLIESDETGKACRDKKGNIKLACACGLVLSCNGNPDDPFVTEGGSWWTNDSSLIKDIPVNKDTRFRPRKQCIVHGYNSIALVPIRNNDEIVGMIQFNDLRKGVFNFNKIEFLEGIASHIGAAYMRKLAEEKLRKNEELLRTITENAPEIIIQLDQQGTIIYMNRAFPGYKMNECIGKNFCEWTSPEYHALMNKSLQLVFNESITQTYLSKTKNLQGETKWYRTSISPVKDEAIVKNAIMITLDITESKLNEEILRDSEEKSKAIIFTAMDGFWLADKHGSFLEVNDAYCRMSGYSRPELLTMGIQNVVVNDNIEEIIAHSNKIVELGEDRFETRHRHKDGSIIFLEVSIQFRPVNGGQFVTFLHDITKRKQREKAMSESNEQFQLLFENSLDAILLTNPDGSVYSANPAAERMFGRSKEELSSLKRNEISDENDSRLIPSLEERRKTGHFQGELNYLRKDGTIFPVEVTSTIFKDSNGNERSSIIARDISERKNAEENLRINNIRLNLAMSTANITLWEMDVPTGNVLLGNESDEILGYQSDKFIRYTDFTKLVHSDDQAKIMEALQRHLDGKIDKFEVEFRILNQSGVYNWFYIVGSVTKRDAKGMPLIVTGIDIDISDRKQKEHLLLQSEERYKSLFQDNMSVMIILNPDTGEIIDANQAACNYYGWSHTELCNKNISDIDPLPKDETTLKLLHSKGQISDHLFVKHQLANGEFRDVEIYSGPIMVNESMMLYSIIHDITERKLAEEALRLSERRLDAVFNSVTETIMMLDADGFILTVNSTAAKRFGMTVNELVGQNIFKMSSPEAGSIRTEHIRKMKDTALPIRFEDEVGDKLYNNIFYPIPDPSGKIEQFIVINHDITESRRAQEALLINVERYELIYNSSRDGIFSLNKEGYFTGANRSFCEELKFDLSYIIGHTFKEVGLPVYICEELDNFKKQVLETNNSVVFELTLPVQDGNIRYYELILNPLHDGKENIVGLGGSLRNITKRKEANQALLETEKRFRHLVKDMPVGVILYGPEPDVIMSNPKALELLGVTKEQFAGNITFNPVWKMIHEDGSVFYNSEQPVEQVYETLRSVHNVVIGISRPDSKKITWLLKNAEILFKEDGSIRNVVCSIIDITERKEKEETLRKLNMTLSAISKSSQAMNLVKDETEYLKKVCNIVVEDTDFSMVWIGYAGEDETKTIRPMASAGFNGFPVEIKLSWDNKGSGPTGIAIRTGKVGMYNNVFTDPAYEPWREEALKYGFASSIVFPLIDGEKAFGAITIYSKEPDSFLNDEVQLLSKLASDLAHGITTIRLRAAHELTEIALIKSHSELEMTVKKRTAELIKSNEALKFTEEKYRTVADFATNWEFWISPDDQMIYCSPSCEQVTGYSAAEFIDNSQLIFDIIHPDDLQMYQEHKKKEMQPFVSDHEIQYRIFKKDGAIRWISHFCQPVFDDKGIFRGIRGSNKDITARKKMEELLTTSNQKYKLLSENITDGIFICKNGRFEYINKAINDIFGYSGKEMEGMKLTQLILADYHEELENFLYTNFNHNKSCNIEVICLKKDYTSVFVEILLNYVSKDKMVYGVVHNITEKKLFQKNMLKAIIQTEEKERAHFSKELHDGLGPLLSTIKLYLQWSERPNIKKSREEIIGKAAEILEEALTTVKEISTKLSPHLLTNYGLSSAIKSFVEKLNETASYNIEFESNTNRRFDGDIEASLYRAIIECINNTLKYAHAKNIFIKLKDTGSQVQLQYKDDGTGFDIARAIDEHKGLGLFNLQNRLHTIGGTVDLKSEQGNGVDYLFTVDI
jgi:PAS domain S-box-containing protein